MAKSVNRTFLLGHVGKNPEVGTTTGRHARRQLFSRDYRPGEGPSGQLVRQDRVAQPGRLRPDRGDRAGLCEQGHATLHPGQDSNALLG